MGEGNARIRDACGSPVHRVVAAVGRDADVAEFADERDLFQHAVAERRLVQVTPMPGCDVIAEQGVLAAMKGAYPHAEIERLPEGFRIRAVTRLAVPGVAGERHLVLVERATS